MGQNTNIDLGVDICITKRSKFLESWSPMKIQAGSLRGLLYEYMTILQVKLSKGLNHIKKPTHNTNPKPSVTYALTFLDDVACGYNSPAI